MGIKPLQAFMNNKNRCPHFDRVLSIFEPNGSKVDRRFGQTLIDIFRLLIFSSVTDKLSSGQNGNTVLHCEMIGWFIGCKSFMTMAMCGFMRG
jgi:hypothetical protein